MAKKKTGSIELTLTAAVGIAGKIKKAGEDVTVSEAVARNFLHRRVATLKEGQDLDGTGIVDPDDLDSGAANGFPPPAKDGQNRSGSPLDNPQGKAELGSNATPGAGSGAPPAKDATAGNGAAPAKDAKATAKAKGGKS